MPAEKPKTQPKHSATKSGIFPRPNFAVEPEAKRDPPPPPNRAPEPRTDHGATTGMMPIITEGEDKGAQRDDDVVNGR